MATILLSGGGYSGNWLPLITPLAVIVIIFYAADFLRGYLKQRKLHKQALPAHEPGSLEDATEQTDDVTS